MDTQIDSAGRAPSSAQPKSSALAQARVLALRLGGLFFAIAIVIVVFTMLKPAFFTTAVQVSVLRTMSSMAIMSLGLLLVIVVGEIDLSFASTYGLAANTVAVLWVLDGWPVGAAIVAALVVCVIVGLVNGLLVTRLNIPSFIVTLGTYNLIYGASLLITKSQSINPAYPPDGGHLAPSELSFFHDLTASITSDKLSLEVLWMVGLAIVIGILLHRSLFGFRLRAIGGNPQAARLARLPVASYKTIAFVLCAVLAGVAGILDFSFIGAVQPEAGLSSTFPVFAAVIIGGASLAGGRGTVIGTLGGALLLASLSAGLSLVSPGAYAQQIFLGAVTIGAVVLDIYSRKFLDRSRA